MKIIMKDLSTDGHARSLGSFTSNKSVCLFRRPHTHWPKKGGGAGRNGEGGEGRGAGKSGEGGEGRGEGKSVEGCEGRGADKSGEGGE